MRADISLFLFSHKVTEPIFPPCLSYMMSFKENMSPFVEVDSSEPQGTPKSPGFQPAGSRRFGGEPDTSEGRVRVAWAEVSGNFRGLGQNLLVREIHGMRNGMSTL